MPIAKKPAKSDLDYDTSDADYDADRDTATGYAQSASGPVKQNKPIPPAPYIPEEEEEEAYPDEAELVIKDSQGQEKVGYKTLIPAPVHKAMSPSDIDASDDDYTPEPQPGMMYIVP